MSNEYTKQDRACVNCKHFRRRYSLFAIFDLIFSDGKLHYRCTFNGIKEEFNAITGRVKTKVNDTACAYMRSSRFDNCSNGRYWEPSQRFIKKKENLFKVLNNV